MASSAFEELRLELMYRAPEGRKLDQLIRCQNRLSCIAVSDRGVMEEFCYELVCGGRARALADRFWQSEGIVFDSIEAECQEYQQVTDRVFALGETEWRALMEFLKEEFPDSPWDYTCVELTPEMKAAAVRIGRRILGKNAPPPGDRPMPRYQRDVSPT